ncbi:hypothetical protein [Bernardetia litoralis]|uniref:hypothetical protein n=1 Tax=Bernardetia litoralis TaxID=999 RepID=UPI001FDF13DE|nr:hypothetical protein [Bernardetia litoralis]
MSDKTYYAKNLANRENRFKVADFSIGITSSDYYEEKHSYLGHQDSSYIRLYNPRFIRTYSLEPAGLFQSQYLVNYNLYVELYANSGTYLYPMRASGNFIITFYH